MTAIDHSKRIEVRDLLFALVVTTLAVVLASGSTMAAGNLSQLRGVLDSPSESNTTWSVAGGATGKPHYSELDQINRETISDLSLAWAAPISSPLGLTAEPIVVDGVAYISAAFSVVRAIDVRSGKELWTFTPDIDLTHSVATTYYTRTNRGVAVADGLVYVAVADCRVIALSATTGKATWEAQVCNNGGNKDAGITGAPAVGGGLVFIGSAGTDFGVRGAIVALDATSGEEAWRFWTVPKGDGTVENEAMRRASESWGDSTPQGGGLAWDAITFDAITNRVYFGTSSRYPYLNEEGKPHGGDNLYTTSIIALEAGTGEYAWHYQTVPQDIWDYDATMHISLADIQLSGEVRRVVLNAPKNGFFYVLDALNGDLLSADPYVRVTWASHVDLETGRPVLKPEGQFYNFPGQKTKIYPGAIGAHNWQSMAVDPKSGTVFIPANELGGYYGIKADGSPWYDASSFDDHGNPIENAGRLIAWDVAGKSIRWSVDLRKPFNGGALATAGGLVFLGESTGRLAAYDTDSGRRVWEFQTGSSINANPATFSLDGDQYILQGVGQASETTMSDGNLTMTAESQGGPTMLMAFKLKGDGKMPDLARYSQAVPTPPRVPDESQVAAGKELWKLASCAACHGYHVSGVQYRRLDGGIPDLRYSPKVVHDQWLGILYGARRDKGMPSFGGLLEFDHARAIQEYVLYRSWDKYCAENAERSAQKQHEYCRKHRSP